MLYEEADEAAAASETLRRLRQFAHDLASLQQTTDEIETAFRFSANGPAAAAGKCTTELAQVEARANKLQADVDSVGVGGPGGHTHLHGVHAARALRKQLVGKLEALEGRMRTLFALFADAKRGPTRQSSAEARPPSGASVEGGRRRAGPQDEHEEVVAEDHSEESDDADSLAPRRWEKPDAQERLRMIRPAPSPSIEAKRPFASVEGNVRPRSREPCYNDASWHNGLGLGRTALFTRPIYAASPGDFGRRRTFFF